MSGPQIIGEGPLVAAALAVLDGIVDPCSVTAGVPISILGMGLVRVVECTPAGPVDDLRVTLAITEPGCLMAAPFVVTARERLAELAGVGSVEVTVDTDYMWDPDDMSAADRQRLRDARRLAAQSRPGLTLSIS